MAREYEMPKPHIRQIVPQQIQSSIFEPAKPEKAQESNSMNASSLSNSWQHNNANVPGWSFVNPGEHD